MCRRVYDYICIGSTIWFAFMLCFIVIFSTAYNFLDHDKLPNYTTFNGTLNLEKDQDKQIFFNEEYFSGGFKNIDKAQWIVNLTIWGETDDNLERLIIRSSCMWSNLNSYIYDRKFVITYRVDQRVGCSIIVHNIAIVNNNATYIVNIFSQGNYDSWRFHKIGIFFAQDFVFLIAIILLCIPIVILIILILFSCITSFCEYLFSRCKKIFTTNEISLNDPPQQQNYSDEEL